MSYPVNVMFVNHSLYLEVGKYIDLPDTCSLPDTLSYLGIQHSQLPVNGRFDVQIIQTLIDELQRLTHFGQVGCELRHF